MDGDRVLFEEKYEIMERVARLQSDWLVHGFTCQDVEKHGRAPDINNPPRGHKYAALIRSVP